MPHFYRKPPGKQENTCLEIQDAAATGVEGQVILPTTLVRRPCRKESLHLKSDRCAARMNDSLLDMAEV
jgi:hypothetical protein